MSGEITLTGIEEAEANDEDEETRQNGVQGLQGKEPKQVSLGKKI